VATGQAVKQKRRSIARLPCGRTIVVQHNGVVIGHYDKVPPCPIHRCRSGQIHAGQRLQVPAVQEGMWLERRKIKHAIDPFSVAAASDPTRRSRIILQTLATAATKDHREFGGMKRKSAVGRAASNRTTCPAPWGENEGWQKPGGRGIFDFVDLRLRPSNKESLML
jgi:hypothetical protein